MLNRCIGRCACQHLPHSESTLGFAEGEPDGNECSDNVKLSTVVSATWHLPRRCSTPACQLNSSDESLEPRHSRRIWSLARGNLRRRKVHPPKWLISLLRGAPRHLI